MNKHAESSRVARRSWRAVAVGAALAGLAALPIGAALGGEIAATTGGGEYRISDTLLVKFSVAAVAADAEAAGTLLTGPARGQFRQSVVLDGQLIEFHGEAVCVTVDPVNHRAWIGGVVTHNNSEHPAFTTAIHQPGRDVWFRVLDLGEGAAAEPDRSTFLGFEGAAGIITSPEYCEAAIWPDDNARTSPVTQGNIQVRP